MARIFRKTEYTPEERAEIERIRKLPKSELIKTTGEKIGSHSYNAISKPLSALRARARRTRTEPDGTRRTHGHRVLGSVPAANVQSR
jgi:hypothetical protein